jgi:hypothetical protein
MAQATIQVFEHTKEVELTRVMAVTLGKAQRDILQALSVFPYFTSEQLSRYLELNLRYIQDNLKTLTDAKFILPLTPTKQLRVGSLPYVYTLAAKGRKYVASEGLEDALETRTDTNGEEYKTRFRPSEERKKTFTLLHSIAVSEVLLKAKLLTREEPSIALTGYVKERGFEVSPLRVTVSKGGRERVVSLSPDLWLDFELDEYRYCFLIEVNLTPVEQKRWRHKVASYLASLAEYKRRFETDILVVVTFIESPVNFPKGKRTGRTSFENMRFQEEERVRTKRMQDMLRWTERELSARNVPGASDHFLFTTVDLNSASPRDIFLAPLYRTPFSQGSEPLIPLAEEAESG